MLFIDSDGNIQLTRGDTARLNIAINIKKSEQKYEMGPDDVLRLTVKKKSKLPEYIFKKEITGSTTFHIKPEDTNGVPFGKYVYDVELTTSAGDVYTIIGYDPVKGSKKFELLEEVTW